MLDATIERQVKNYEAFLKHIDSVLEEIDSSELLKQEVWNLLERFEATSITFSANDISDMEISVDGEPLESRGSRIDGLAVCLDCIVSEQVAEQEKYDANPEEYERLEEETGPEEIEIEIGEHDVCSRCGKRI